MLVLFVVAVVAPLAAQDPGPHFEVASIKRADPNVQGILRPAGATGFQPGGRFVARNMAGERLLVLAFRDEGAGTGLRPEQIVGVPSWLTSTMYDIDARAAGATSAERIVDPEAARLLRSLLVDRFKLKYHFEERELPFYALLVDKADGALGPNLKPSALDCNAIARERDAARLANRPAAVPAPAGGRPVCALGLSRGKAIGGGVTMTIVASMLTGAAGNTTVLDRTGLSGAYDLDLAFSPETLTATPDVPPDVSAPSLFTAVREQLGLRLERRREPRPVLVVDAVEPPAPD
jgi:uncharacterized protein (TIGR03435 family)